MGCSGGPLFQPLSSVRSLVMLCLNTHLNVTAFDDAVQAPVTKMAVTIQAAKRECC